MLSPFKTFLYEILVNAVTSLLLDLLHRVLDHVAPACWALLVLPSCGLS